MRLIPLLSVILITHALGCGDAGTAESASGAEVNASEATRMSDEDADGQHATATGADDASVSRDGEGGSEGSQERPGEVELRCEHLCEAGAERCAEDLALIETCTTGPDGCFQWTPAASCLAGDICVDAACLTPTEPYDFEANAPWHTCPAEMPSEGVSVVNAFEAADQYFGDPNLRQIESEVTFPESGSWSSVGMWFQLECPSNGLCDHWDRSGSVQLVLNPDAPEGEPKEYVELLRHITPYRVGMCQFVDVTPLAHLLKGTRTLNSWIDTWVGPGHAQGEGWRVTVNFVFYPGPDAGAAEVLNIWGRRSITVGEVEPDKNVDSQIEPVSVEIPDTANQVIAHLTTTGHSFGNTYNCAEFCQMRHDIIIDGAVVESINPWRPDCAQNPVSPQYGTWEYPRNGWCPGGSALGTLVDITPYVSPGESTSVDLDIRMYDGAEYDNMSPVDLLPYTYVSLKLCAYE